MHNCKLEIVFSMQTANACLHTFQVNKEGKIHLLAGPKLPAKSLCQGGLTLCIASK